MANIFSNAVKDAISVRVNTDGIRYVGRSMDREANTRGSNSNSYNNRDYTSNHKGRGRGGDNGGRWQRGGGYGGNRGGNRGGYRGGNRGGGRPFRGGFRPRGRGRGRGRDYETEDDEGDCVMKSTYRERSPESSSSSGWWKITIVNGKHHSRDWLLKRVKETCRLPVRESNFHVEGIDSVFLVNDKSVADALEDTSNRITTKDGSKIIIEVKPTDRGGARGAVRVDQSDALDDRGIELLKQCLGKRFEVETLKLNLSELAKDPLLKKVQGRVDQPRFMNQILDLIHSVCPNLKILDLSSNRIPRLDNLSQLAEKCPALDELILSYNDIRSTVELAKIKDHKTLTKLWFKGNPGQLQYTSNNSAYLADIRKRLSNITMLDGLELPSTIKFELQPENETHVPVRKDVYACSGKDYELVKVFVQNFFKVYDSEDGQDRQRLLEAYHNDASFSLCCNTGIQTAKPGSLSTYIKISRNLRNIKDSKSRNSFLKHKKLNIVAFLTELPKTKHLLESFSLDLTLSTLHMLCFTVQGIFFEGTEESARAFSRTFIGQRESETVFVIVNDQLHIRNITDKQNALLEEATSSKPAPAAPAANIDPQQEELVKKFSEESKMNIQYSLMCLQSANWDYQAAAKKFLEVRATIPKDAFVQ